MKTALQVVFRDIPPSPTIEAEIRRRAAKLEQAADSIMSCRVTLSSSGRHRHQGVLREVHIDLRLPREEIAVTRHHADEDLYVAIRDAFGSVRRRIDEHRRRAQDDVRTHVPARRGGAARPNGEADGFAGDGDGHDDEVAHAQRVEGEPGPAEAGGDLPFAKTAADDGPQVAGVSAGRPRGA